MTDLNHFREALKFTLKWEGEYSNDSDDPGGETKWGITKKSYPKLKIKDITPEQALDIYHQDYWLASGCDDIPFPYSVVVFDTAVNCGVDRTKDWVRKSKNIDDLIEFRKRHYMDIVNRNNRMIKYARGWWNRMQDLIKVYEVLGGIFPEKKRPT